MKLSSSSKVIISIIALIYCILCVFSLDSCYFGDNIQQISKEGHWFYLTNFNSLLMPALNSGSEIVATGYHPPLMGLITAFLWKIVGYKLWVSHVFAGVWAMLLIVNIYKLSQLFFSEKYIGWVMLVVLLEPTILSQFYVASPDFILLTAFVISMRAILEDKKWLLGFAVFVLFGINMRGIFAGSILVIAHLYLISNDSSSENKTSSYLKALVPYSPIFILLIAYFSYYLFQRGWFFSTAYSDHYSQPNDISSIVNHFAAFSLRTIENGRVLIWVIALYVAYKVVMKKQVLDKSVKTLVLVLILLNGLYLLFVFITQMPFSSRYFMPQHFILSLLVMYAFVHYLSYKKSLVLFVTILVLEITGNFWIYPDKIAKSWDGTLAHISFYDVRKDCYDYIDSAKIDYKQISAGFCLYGNRQYVEMLDNGKTVSSGTNGNYFIYSNISNNEDGFVKELENPLVWTQLKSFEKGVVTIIIFERVKNKFKK